jgi:2,4-dienoyl-CoA reductase-like NADH-dependent reductase (Old Yellow Enzyme family)/thioredoxin reductase
MEEMEMMPRIMYLEKLFQPISLGELEIRNRIVMPSMGTNFANEDGYVTEQLKSYYEERARSGVGLIIIEFSCIQWPVGKGQLRQLCVDDDKFIPGLSELAQTIKKHGARVFLQLHHAGRVAFSRFTGCQPVAPSPIPTSSGEMPRELSLAEIKNIIYRFAEGAHRAQEAGFDGVELHCTHGYLLAQFLSAASNKRQDIYGGDLRNRARLILDIMAAVRDKVGANYPVSIRLTGKEFDIEHGITIEESQQTAKWLEEAGAAAINVSVSGHYPLHAMEWLVEGEDLPRPPYNHPHGFVLFVAEKIKRKLNVPVIGVGWIDPETAELALRENKIDMVAMGRSLIADPELPRKAASGSLEDIRPCLGCLICRERLLSEKQVQCTVNPTMGKEQESLIALAKKKKRIVVVGGGPAGMEAARVAALKGHEVILFDKGSSLGGQLLVASIPPNKGRLKVLADYFTTQVSKLGVKVELGKEAISEDIVSVEPDAVIIAAGVKRRAPRIPGIELGNMANAEDILVGKVRVAGRKVAVIGGGVVGCETAEFLATKKKRVTIVEMLDIMATGMEEVTKNYLLGRLSKLGVTILTKTKAEAITEEGLVVSPEEGPKQIVEADTIVNATSPYPNQRLYQELSGKISKIHLVGDCVEPRRIKEAIEEGFRIGLEV